MTAPQTKAEPRAGKAPLSEQIAMIKARNLMVAQVASTNWGMGLSPIMQRAVAEYIRVTGLDLTEIDILGGRIYRNSVYSLRRLSELVAEGKIEYARADFIHEDPRLTEIAENADAPPPEREWAIAEIWRRKRECITRSIPLEAHYACVFRVKVRGVDGEFADAKWIQLGRLNRKDKLADPIGNEHPIETLVSRAAHRTLRFVSTKFEAIGSVERQLDEIAEAIIEEIPKDERKAEPAAREEPRPDRPPIPEEYYPNPAKQLTEGAPPDPLIQRLDLEKAARAMAGPDPYTDAVGAESGTEPAPIAAAAEALTPAVNTVVGDDVAPAKAPSDEEWQDDRSLVD